MALFDFKRLFRTGPGFTAPRDGLTGGDVSLLELIDLDLLKGEAKAADVTAGRVSTTDRAAARLRQARIWREVARRTGDAILLRRAASAAELALHDIDGLTKPRTQSAARLEQAMCTMLGAQLFGDDGLNAAAEIALAQAEAAPGPAAALARAKRAVIAAHQALSRHDALEALGQLTAFDRVFTDLKPQARDRDARLALAEVRLDRAELTAACGRMLKDDRLIARALADAASALTDFNISYEPLTVARGALLRAEGLIALGELTGDAGVLAEAVETVSRLFEDLPRDHSPLDWARAQYVHGQALQALAEAAEAPEALVQAERAFDRALHVLAKEPALMLRAEAANARAACLVRQAELSDDLTALDQAEAIFRVELARTDPARDAMGWALSQLSLARVYQARLTLTGRDRGERAQAAMAFDAALEVFAELGRRDLADLADAGMKQLAQSVV
jgi:tetratricopeptide (TPR) repeat protein